LFYEEAVTDQPKDEIDALGTSRPSEFDTGSGPSHEGVLTSLLNEMDGVQELVGVTIIAATNRPEVIVSPCTGRIIVVFIIRHRTQPLCALDD